MVQLSDATGGELGEEWEQLLKAMLDGEIKAGDIDKLTALSTAKEYMGGVLQSFGGDFSRVDYDSPDVGLLANLEKNCYQFAGAKNYQQLRQLNDLLRDGNRMRSFNEFKKEATPLLKEWNGVWMQTEYNTAVNSAVNARKWQDFSKNAAIMPLLRFKIVRDERTCPICLPFADMVRPIDDPVWDYATPSLHFGDRCTIQQLPDDTTPITQEVPGSEAVPKMFRVNMAKQQLAFPPDHPYYNGLPKTMDKEVIKMQRTDVRRYAKEQFAGKELQSPLGKVQVGMYGIKEAIAQPHNAQYEKNAAIRYLDQLLNKSTHTGSAPDTKGDAKAFHYLQTNIAHKPSWIVVRETHDGQKHFYSIVDKLRK